MKTTALIIILSLVTVLYTCGQGTLRQIETGKFEKAEKELAKDLEKSPNDLIANYSMTLLLINRQYNGYNPEKSYNFWLITSNAYKKISDEKEIRKLEKIPLNAGILTNLLDTIGRCALEDAAFANEIARYNSYLKYFVLVPEQYKKTAIAKRDSVAYKAASDIHTADSYQRFITDYPGAVQAGEAISKRNALAFALVKETDKIDHYKNFISTYPEAREVSPARERIHELAFEEAQKENTGEAYEKYMKEYPQSQQVKTALDLFEKIQFAENTIPGQWESYRDFIEDFADNSLVTAAEDTLLNMGRKAGDWRILKFCADNFTGEKEKKALRLFHDVITHDGEEATLDVFYDEYDNTIFRELKSRDYEIAEMGNRLELNEDYDPDDFEFYDEYIRMAAPKEKAFVALQRVISKDVAGKNWKSAISKVNTYAPYFGENRKIYGLLDVLGKASEVSIQVFSAGSGVNRVKGREYVPVISADDKSLYFCGRERSDNVGGEDIFVSVKAGNSWGNSRIVSDLSSEYSNDAPLSISSDGTTMLLFISGAIYYSDKTSAGWSETVEFPEEINAANWQADAMISSDGKALIFTSTREGGFNIFGKYEDVYHGDTQFPSDIYVSLPDNDENWSEPVNLGDVINTPYSERTPFLHPDMKTLYFSSDGHGGLGKLDVFRSVRLADSCWNCWSEPVNMGKEINTRDSDWGYKISTDGTKAYFSKINPASGQEDIYWLTIPNYLRPELVATVTGKIYDSDKKPVSAEIRWEDLETGKNVGRSKSDPSDGSYFIVLPMGKIYGYFVDVDNYFPLSNNLDLRKGNKPIDVVENIELVSFRQMEEEETAVTINNLFFNFAESTLLPTSIPELKRVAGIIRSRRIKVEISGHADNIGDDANNKILSERRAKAVRDFLVREGCNGSDLVAVGYGESRPVASNDTDAGRAKNRRVEMKIIN